MYIYVIDGVLLLTFINKKIKNVSINNFFKQFKCKLTCLNGPSDPPNLNSLKFANCNSTPLIEIYFKKISYFFLVL